MPSEDRKLRPVDSFIEPLLQQAFPSCRLLESSRLNGGVSSGATLCSLQLPEGTVRKVVVRRPFAPAAGADLSRGAREQRVLALAQKAGIPAPKLAYFEPSLDALVLEYVPGRPELAPVDLARSMQRMAQALATVHGVTSESGDLTFLPRRSETAGALVACWPEKLDETLDEARLRAALRPLWPWPQRNPNVLLHGDYWPGNVLWQDGQLTAIIDWEESELGDPLADVALARLDLWWAFGRDAAEAFTRHYQSATNIDWQQLPHWDLCIALRPMSNLPRWASAYPKPPISRPDIDEAHMTAIHRQFVAQALARLGA